MEEYVLYTPGRGPNRGYIYQSSNCILKMGKLFLNETEFAKGSKSNVLWEIILDDSYVVLTGKRTKIHAGFIVKNVNVGNQYFLNKWFSMCDLKHTCH